MVVYYAALIAWVGCHVDAYEQAKWFGDDLALKADFRRVDFASAAAWADVHAGSPRRWPPGVQNGHDSELPFLAVAAGRLEEMLENHWLAADALAARLGLDQQVRDSVEQTFERWDGKGVPKGARGEEFLLTSRLVTLADVVEVYQRAEGTDAAIAVARRAARDPVRSAGRGHFRRGGSIDVRGPRRGEQPGTPSSEPSQPWEGGSPRRSLKLR